MNALEVPEALAGVGVESEEGVGVEVVAEAVEAVEVVDGGAGGDVDDAALFVEGHAGPVVGGAGDLPGVFGPGLVAGFAGKGDGVEDPAELAGVDVVGADVAVQGRFGLGRAEADDDHVFIDEAGGGEGGEGLSDVFFVEIFAEVDLAAVTEGGDEFAGCGIDRVEVAQKTGEENALGSVGPVAETTCGLQAGGSGAEGPEIFSGGCVERDDFLRWGEAEENAADDQRIGLEAAGLLGVEAPCDFEFVDVGAVDLMEGGVVIVCALTAVDWPVRARWGVLCLCVGYGEKVSVVSKAEC